MEKQQTQKSIEHPYCRKAIWMLLKLSFSNLHQFPHLKELALYFDVLYHHAVPYDCAGYPSYKVVREIGNSHQWDILRGIGSNTNPLPELRFFEMDGWHCSSEFSSLFDGNPVAQLFTSLRHLHFSLPLVRPEHSASHELLWNQVVMRRMLQPAVNLESLEISGNHAWDSRRCLDMPRTQLAPHPRLTVLSLWSIRWEDGKIGPGGIIMPSPLEDFIVRHRTTLKKLCIDDCSINVGDISRLPFCYWADIYKRLTEALTELEEVEVDFSISPYESPYVYMVADTPFPVEGLIETEGWEGLEQDKLALKEFKAVVKKRRTGGVEESDGALI